MLNPFMDINERLGLDEGEMLPYSTAGFYYDSIVRFNIEIGRLIERYDEAQKDEKRRGVKAIKNEIISKLHKRNQAISMYLALYWAETMDDLERAAVKKREEQAGEGEGGESVVDPRD